MDGFGTRPVCFGSTLQECAFVMTATLATAQTSLFGGIVACITSRIAEDLHMSIAEITWLSAAQALVPILKAASVQPFTVPIIGNLLSNSTEVTPNRFLADFTPRLAAGSFLLFFGRVADLFGRRLVLICGMTCYSACLLIAGFATNAIFLGIFCGLTGLCSAASVPAAIGTLGAAYSHPSRRKNIAFACFSAGNPLGFGAGALLSGLLNECMPWRASFWTLAVIYGLFAAFSWWAVPPEQDNSSCALECATLARLDWLGAVAIVAGLALVLSGMTYDHFLDGVYTRAERENRSAATAPNGWLTDYIIAFVSFGVILIMGFVLWQGLSSNPLMPLHVWEDKNFSLVSVAITPSLWLSTDGSSS